ncbi:MAG: exodeoxyribonuclease VII small subunit [Terriglobales bacterium]
MPPAASFELSLERLEAIVADLERADLPLERSVQLFEEGMALVEECRKQLDAAEGKVEMLVRRAGAVVAEPFALDDRPSEP